MFATPVGNPDTQNTKNLTKKIKTNFTKNTKRNQIARILAFFAPILESKNFCQN